MEPISLLVSSALFVATQLVRRPTDECADHVWGRVKKAFRDRSDREPVATEITETALQVVLDRAQDVAADLDLVVERFSALRRARLVGEVLRGARILWIDDHPENNALERRLFESLGFKCLNAETTRSAAAYLLDEAVDVIISDIARGDNLREGVDALSTIRASAPTVPVLFYVGQLSSSIPPLGAQGITDEPNELLHLVFDQLERKRV